MRFLVALVFAGPLAFVQKPAFEVVSINQAPPSSVQGMRMGSRGGPRSADPGRWVGENLSISDLVHNAYNLKRHEYSGPSWMGDARFDIQAKVPAGATRDDVKLMLQGMLEERFHLQFHRETKEMAGFELVVAKNGPKLKESEPQQPAAAGAPPPQGGPLKLGPTATRS
jgi:uncharacterized protein (TIGR03435 family)